MKSLNAKNREANLIFCLLICSSFLSVHILPINPVYIIGMIAIFLASFYVRFDRFDKFALTLFFYLLISIIFFMVGIENFKKINYSPNYQSSILYLFCIVLGFVTIFVGERIGESGRVFVYKLIVNFIIFFLSIDLISRLIFSGNSGSFYDYKFGPFYLDSNFTGNVLLCFIMFYYVLYKKNILNIGFFKFSILLILLLGTFSRAAIFALIISFLLFNLNQKYRVLILLTSGVLGLFLIYTMIGFYLSGSDFLGLDPSFNSKFILIDIALENYGSIPLINKMFGIGLNNFSYYSNGMFAHNFFITFFYEFGIFGILSFSYILIKFYSKVKSDSLYLIFPFLLSSFSLFSAYMPFFFVIMSCIYLEKNIHKE